MLPAGCSLEEADLRAQLARYRGVGTGADILERSTQRLVIRMGDAVSDGAVEELLAVERSCCPFFGMGWDPRERCISVSVSRPEDERALDAIAYALGFRGRGRPAEGFPLA